MRVFRRFTHKKAIYNILNCGFDAATREIVRQRVLLEGLIDRYPDFMKSLAPLPSLPDAAPEVATHMHRASLLTGVGPMAAVAGGLAEAGVRAALGTGCGESVIENGGDVYMVLEEELSLGIYAEGTPFENTLAFRILPEHTPLAVCSSSSTMGHSLSLGSCDLTTVFSTSGTLADAAATMACNMIKKEADIGPVLDRVMQIPGILGLLIIKNDKIGMNGAVPEVIRNTDPEIPGKVTRHGLSNFGRSSKKQAGKSGYSI